MKSLFNTQMGDDLNNEQPVQYLDGWQLKQ